MLDPRRVDFRRDAFPGDMILVSITDAYAYDDGKRTDQVIGVKCSVVLPSCNYERLNVKLPAGTKVDEDLIGNPVDFSGFVARIYAMDGRIGFSITATSVAAAT